MKKLLLLLLTIPFFSFSQHSDRILQIKEMYKETKSYSKDEKCKTINWEEIEELGGGVQRPLDREVTQCVYPMGYKKITLNFAMLDSYLTIEYYFVDDKLFFVYEIVEVGSWDDDKIRVYFKENGEIEKILINYEGEGDKKVTNRTEKERIKKDVLEWLDIAKKEYNKRK